MVYLQHHPRQLLQLKKIDLFLKLFRCRDDVYPKLWENKSKGTKGYSPVCTNEWVRGVCGKPRVKCSECQSRSFLKLDAVAVDAHLRGTATIGTYAIRADDSCVFLACDFDGNGWQDDVKVYRNIARSLGVDVAVERSRSGAGAHAWIFFQSSVPARLARLLGTVILSKCSEYRPNMSLESFDRFFPNQDYLPKGGFGNLIALPLQKLPREQGNTSFLDEDLNVIPDQWGYLAQIKRLSLEKLRSLVSGYFPSKPQTKAEDAFDDVSWVTDQNVLEVSDDSKKEGIAGLLTGQIELRLDSQLHIPLEGLPGKIVTRLKRIASFANPEFYRRQRVMEKLERLIKEQASNDLPDLKMIRMDGNLSAKQRRTALEEVGRSKEDGKPTLIIATASLIGEGFDLADPDTLVLSMPLSFEGRMIQYAGRLHRLSEGKSEVLIYDYLDPANAMLLKMYRNRLKAYRKMGYVIKQMQGGQASAQDLPLT